MATQGDLDRRITKMEGFYAEKLQAEKGHGLTIDTRPLTPAQLATLTSMAASVAARQGIVRPADAPIVLDTRQMTGEELQQLRELALAMKEPE